MRFGWLIFAAAAGIVLAAAFIILAVMLLSRHRKSATGALNLVGAAGSVTSPLAPEGTVLIGGEVWPARSDTGAEIPVGRDNVRVVGSRAHLLIVQSHAFRRDGH